MGNAVCAIIGELQGAAGCCNGGSGLTATTQVNNGADTLHWGDLKLLKGQKVAAGAIAATSNGLRQRATLILLHSRHVKTISLAGAAEVEPG